MCNLSKGSFSLKQTVTDTELQPCTSLSGPAVQSPDFCTSLSHNVPQMHTNTQGHAHKQNTHAPAHSLKCMHVFPSHTHTWKNTLKGVRHMIFIYVISFPHTDRSKGVCSLKSRWNSITLESKCYSGHQSIPKQGLTAETVRWRARSLQPDLWSTRALWSVSGFKLFRKKIEAAFFF